MVETLHLVSCGVNDIIAIIFWVFRRRSIHRTRRGEKTGRGSWLGQFPDHRCEFPDRRVRSIPGCSRTEQTEETGSAAAPPAPSRSELLLERILDALATKKAHLPSASPASPRSEALLGEIRDLLAKQ